MRSQSDSHAQHHERIEGHPRRAIRLLDDVTLGKVRPVDRPDVVQAQEAALKDVVALAVHLVDPPGEVDDQLLEDAGKEVDVTCAIDLEDPDRGPGVHRWVDVVEVPFVRRERAVGVHVPLAEHEQQLVFRVLRVDVREDDGVEGEVPRGEPGVLPRVGHRHDVIGVEVTPPHVAGVCMPRRRRWFGGIAVQPSRYVVPEELLAPDHAGEGATHDVCLIGRDVRRREPGVEVIGFALARLHESVEAALGPTGIRVITLAGRPQAQSHLHGLPGRHRECVMPGALRALMIGIDSGRPMDDVVVDAVFGIGPVEGRAEDALGVGAVVAEERLGRGAIRGRCCIEVIGAQPPVIGDDAARVQGELRRGSALPPGPRVAENRRGQQVQRVRFGSGIRDPDADGRVGGIVLRVSNIDDPVAVLVEGPGVEQLELRILARARTIDGHQLLIGERRLRVVVVRTQPCMRGGGIVVPPVLLGVLAMIALPAIEAEESVLHVTIAAVPHGEGEGEVLVQVAEAEDAVLAPAEGPRSSLVVGEIAPGVAVIGIVLADGAPGSFSEIGTPEVPGPGLLRSKAVVTAVSHASLLTGHPPILP